MDDSDDISPFHSGDHFGDYMVERLLGRGSMGSVYLMRSPDGSPFAVKIMHRSAMSRDMVTRFAREAEFAMEIRHRNLITVYDAGEDPDTGLCYIIMDYMPGGTLSDRIKKLGTIPVGDAVKITMHIAAALDVAHRNGLVHRDVKPDNIMFAADGTPKLADLGVAKFNEDRNTMVTMTGMVIGTPAYMSPEQLMDSHNIDARSDIYSLGVILYEMLTGRRPNSGSTAVELLAKAIKGEPLPDIRTVRPETSAAIAHVLSLMCAPKPDDRPATAVAAAQLLRNAATGKLVLPKKPPRAADAAARKSKRWIPAAAGIVGAAILAAAAMFFMNGMSSPEAPRDPVITNIVKQTVVVTNVVEKKTFAVAEKSATAGVKASPSTGDWQPGPTSDWFVNWDKALKEAKKTGKKLFVLSTGSDWCGWCKRLRANVLDKQEFIDFARKNLVLLYLDSPHANPLCKEQEVHNKQILKALGFGGGVPNVEMFSANGMRLGRIGGGGLALGPYLDKIRGILSETGEPVRRDEGRKLFGFGQGMLTAEKTSNGLPQFTDENGFTWTYRMQGSRVGLASSSNRALLSAPCVSPKPTDVLRIPSQINGLLVAEIGRFAFNKCGEITEVYIPEGVMWLNYGAFCYCDKLQRIVLPSTLSGDFAEAFKFCRRLSTIEFSKENPNYVVDGGVVYSKDRGTLIMFPRSGIDTFDVPKTVHTIAPHAFNSSSIKSINIHDGVKKIGSGAFFECRGLTKIHLRKPVEMGTCVFGYSGLERITFPSGTKVIPSETFRSCSQLKVVNLPESLERIEGHATFGSCSSLVELRLPSRLRMLGDSQLFGYCKSLKRLVIPASVESMSGDGGTFKGCSQLEELIFEGNAPTLNGHEHQGIGGKGQMFNGAPSSVRVLVKKNSTGWNAGSGRGLPEKWPVEGGDGARPIAYLDSDVQKHREDPSADDRRPEPIKVHVSNSKLHAAYRSKERNRVFVEVCHSHDHESFKNPPCTLDRVKEAISCKADILHFPLSRSKDGVLFSAGRENIENFSDGTGSIGDYTARQLKRFKVKWHGNITTKGFATLEEMLKFGKGRILFKVSGACDYAEDLCRLLGKLDAWESVIVESWDISEVQNRYGQRNWDRMRSGELQIMVGGGDGFNEWKAVVPECSVWGEACDLEAHGLKGIPQRINVGFVYGPGEADRTDDEAGWEKALKDGATIFRTNRPVELGKFLKKHGRRK